MAIRYFTGGTGGNWSLLSNWDNYSVYGTVPTTGDTACTNGRNITIDVSLINVGLLTTSPFTTPVIAAGGTMNIANSLTINGSISGGTTSATLTTTHTYPLSLNINGNVYAGAGTNAHGILHNGNGDIDINGNVYGGPTASVYGISNTSIANIYITGNTYGSSTVASSAIFGSTVFNVDVLGDIVAGSAYPSIYLSNTLASLTIRGNVISTNGMFPYAAYMVFTSPTNNQYFILQDNVTSTNTMFSSSAATYGLPVESDVRKGVSFGFMSAYTGTMIIPPASSVSVGVPVDNGNGVTVYGTAINKISDIAIMMSSYLGGDIVGNNLI